MDSHFFKGRLAIGLFWLYLKGNTHRQHPDTLTMTPCIQVSSHGTITMYPNYCTSTWLLCPDYWTSITGPRQNCSTTKPQYFVPVMYPTTVPWLLYPDPTTGSQLQCPHYNTHIKQLNPNYSVLSTIPYTIPIRRMPTTILWVLYPVPKPWSKLLWPDYLTQIQKVNPNYCTLHTVPRSKRSIPTIASWLLCVN